MQKTPKNPSNYLASLPDEVRVDMQTLDVKIAEVMKGQSRVLWEGTFWGGSKQMIIGYGDYTYKRPRGNDVEWFVVGLALQKNYISVYINAVEGKQYVAEKYKDKLGKVKVGKSSISFKKLQDVKIDALMRLLRIAKNQADGSLLQ